ncbi:hypothetical protein L596_024603 [Steinernema carpocapsae]|uniref:Uncharacterized protein n=1 Tax=Steinernema carpocapsae TaxID=34508 RepID=A0A4V5ZZS2_STECR|nr:hypothetical protein L596_024603 [Steinernema carpocapsae]
MLSRLSLVSMLKDSRQLIKNDFNLKFCDNSQSHKSSVTFYCLPVRKLQFEALESAFKTAQDECFVHNFEILEF